MDAHYYLVTDGKTLAIWSVEPQRFLELQKRKPQFTLSPVIGGEFSRLDDSSETTRSGSYGLKYAE